MLRSGGPADLREHCLIVAGHMLRLAGVSCDPTLADVMPMMQEKLRNGAAFERFRRLVKIQGGDVRMVDDPDRLPQARLVETVAAAAGGYVKRMNARAVGLASMALGAGRERKGDPVDHAVGIIAHAKVGDRLAAGDPLFTLHANDANRLAAARSILADAVTLSESPVAPLPLFYDRLEAL